MIALDTNILVRFLVEDDDAQTARVKELLRRSHDDGTTCLITTIVLCELEWVLRKSFKVPREKVAQVVQGFLSEILFEVEESEMVKRALRFYRKGRGDLSDYLVGARGAGLEATTTFTFDRVLRDGEDFTLL